MTFDPDAMQMDRGVIPGTLKIKGCYITYLIETLRYPMGKDGIDSHLAYAAGYMVVTPGRKPVKGDINRYYAEDYKPILVDPLEKSGKLLSDMIESIVAR